MTEKPKGVVKGLNFRAKAEEMVEVIPRDDSKCDCCTTNLGYVCGDCPSGGASSAAKSSGN